MDEVDAFEKIFIGEMLKVPHLGWLPFVKWK